MDIPPLEREACYAQEDFCQNLIQFILSHSNMVHVKPVLGILM